MNKTLQDFLGPNFKDRDTRSADAKAASVKAAVDFCREASIPVDLFSDFVVLRAPLPADVKAYRHADLSRAIVDSITVPRNYMGKNLKGFPLAALGDVTIRSARLISMEGSLQHVSGIFDLSDIDATRIKSWAGCPQFRQIRLGKGDNALHLSSPQLAALQTTLSAIHGTQDAPAPIRPGAPSLKPDELKS